MTPLYISRFVWAILALKFLYLIVETYNVYFHVSGKRTRFSSVIEEWAERSEILFATAMSLLLTIVFSPYGDHTALLRVPHMKSLLYIFGVVSLVTADWQTLLGVRSPLLAHIQRAW